MGTQEKSVENLTDDKQAATSQAAAAVGWMGKMKQEYSKIKENAETYPYVWGSYIVVYGGFGLWFAYRWRKLRRTEDRVRVLQDRLRKMVETQKSDASASAATRKEP